MLLMLFLSWQSLPDYGVENSSMRVSGGQVQHQESTIKYALQCQLTLQSVPVQTVSKSVVVQDHISI